MKRLLALGLLVGLAVAGGVASAEADNSQPVTTYPGARSASGGNVSTTVAVSNTFQSLWVANTARTSCAIQNNGTNSQWVFFGPIANATKAKSVVLSAGQSAYCNNQGLVNTDQVSITGSAGDGFFASQEGAPFIASPPGSGGGGGGGTSSTFGAAFPSTGTAVGMSDGTLMQAFHTTNGTALDINCTVGCAGGTSSNASSGVATSSTNGQTLAWAYGFNGTSWDQLQVDGSKFLKTVVSAALPAGSNVIGHVVADSGSTTAVTQATAGNLNATVVGTGTFADQATLQTQTDTVMVGGVNEKEINGVTPLMGNGTSGTGAQRVAIASDNSAVAGMGVAATGGAPPANAAYSGANVGGNLTGTIGCGSSVVYDASTNGATQLVALQSGQIVYVCGYVLYAAGTVNVDLRYGTGSNCATGGTKILPAFQLIAQGGVADSSPIYRGLKTIASNELCINTSAGVAVQAVVYYTQF